MMNSGFRYLPIPLFLALMMMFQACEATSQNRGGQEDASVRSSILHDFRVVTVVDGVRHPWSLAFLPNGDILVTERGNPEHPGQLRIIRNGELLPDPVQGLPTIRTGGQGGLLDVVLHPDFEQNRLVYLSYSKPNADDSQGTTAVIRGRFEGDALQDVEEIFEAQAWSAGRGHYGSRLAFDQDGYLFITIGDRQTNPAGTIEYQQSHPAQDLSSHMGKVIRLHDDGRVPEDNPFVGDSNALPEIWSYGHRSPQGLAFNTDTGELWLTEHGPQGGDELNLIRKGVNYGWPVIGYGVNYGPGQPLHHVVSASGMERPVAHWLPSVAVSGLTYYTGDAFPRWKGSLFAGGMSENYRTLTRINTDGPLLLNTEYLLSGEFRIRDVRQGPDGFIYLAVDDRAGGLSPIVRLEPAR